jgi:hypothetical protein
MIQVITRAWARWRAGAPRRRYDRAFSRWMSDARRRGLSWPQMADELTLRKSLISIQANASRWAIASPEDAGYAARVCIEKEAQEIAILRPDLADRLRTAMSGLPIRSILTAQAMRAVDALPMSATENHEPSERDIAALRVIGRK